MAFTHALATNKYGNSKLIVATDAAYGTHTTLASAMADAVSGDTIFLRDSVTENVTITPGVNIAGWSGSTLNVPTITGTLTMTGAGTSTLSGLRLVTNGSTVISVTGSAASILNVNDCYLSMATDGITYSSSSSSSRLSFFNCRGDLSAAAIRIFAHSSSGIMNIIQSSFTNSGSSTTANTLSAGTLNFNYSLISNPITTSGSTCSYASNYSMINCNLINTTALTHGCTNATASASVNCNYASGTASAISVSASCTLNSINDAVGSNNTNAVTGAGIISYNLMAFFGTSNTINTTTQTGSVTNLGISRSQTQPAFLARSGAQSNVTGDGTNYTVTFTSEIFDQNNNFDGTSTFTAPYTGRYNLGTLLSFTTVGAGHTSGFTVIVTSNRNYSIGGNPANERNSGNSFIEGLTVLADMDVGDTATSLAQISNSTKTVGIGATNSTFFGNLVA